MIYGQWTYDDYADTIGKDMYSMAINKNLTMVKAYEEITLSLQDRTLPNGHRNIKLTFIMGLGQEVYFCSAYCKDGTLTLTTRLDKIQYLSEFIDCTKLEVEVLKNNHFKPRVYTYNMKNTPEAYQFIINH
jgi:hypothetical protein